VNNKEAWGMDSTQRKFCKKKGKIEAQMHWKRNEHDENEFKFIKGLSSFKMDLPPIQGH